MRDRGKRESSHVRTLDDTPLLPHSLHLQPSLHLLILSGHTRLSLSLPHSLCAFICACGRGLGCACDVVVHDYPRLCCCWLLMFTILWLRILCRGDRWAAGLCLILPGTTLVLNTLPPPPPDRHLVLAADRASRAAAAAALMNPIARVRIPSSPSGMPISASVSQCTWAHLLALGFITTTVEGGKARASCTPSASCISPCVDLYRIRPCVFLYTAVGL